MAKQQTKSTKSTAGSMESKPDGKKSKPATTRHEQSGQYQVEGGGATQGPGKGKKSK